MDTPNIDTNSRKGDVKNNPSHPAGSSFPASLWLSRLLLRLSAWMPAARHRQRQIEAGERTLQYLTDAEALIAYTEAKHADKWPTMRTTTAGRALLDSTRPEIAVVAALVREGLERVKAGDPLSPGDNLEAVALVFLRTVHRLLDQVEAEIAAERHL